jgi:hypothetical protein
VPCVTRWRSEARLLSARGEALLHSCIGSRCVPSSGDRWLSGVAAVLGHLIFQRFRTTLCLAVGSRLDGHTRANQKNIRQESGLVLAFGPRPQLLALFYVYPGVIMDLTKRTKSQGSQWEALRAVEDFLGLSS